MKPEAPVFSPCCDLKKSLKRPAFHVVLKPPSELKKISFSTPSARNLAWVG